MQAKGNHLCIPASHTIALLQGTCIIHVPTYIGKHNNDYPVEHSVNFFS